MTRGVPSSLPMKGVDFLHPNPFSSPDSKSKPALRHLGMGQKLSNIHCLVDKTMNMCGSYLTKTYLINSGASSCTCIGIAGCLPYKRGSFT